jgi:DNA-binding IclR family transcriptional regulator
MLTGPGTVTFLPLRRLPFGDHISKSAPAGSPHASRTWFEQRWRRLFRNAEFSSARLTVTLGIASIAVNSACQTGWGFAVTAYETWSTEARRNTAAGQAPLHDRKFVVALARGLDVLRAFTATDGLLGNQEIATRASLPKATVSRLTYTLTKLGYLTHHPRLSKYQLAPAALSIGYSALANMRIRQIARPYMQELANYTGASVALGSRDRLNVIYIEHCRSAATMMLRLDLGARIPIATTAMGRALLAATPEKERVWLLEHIARREGDRWPKVRTGIEQAIKDFANQGFTFSVGDWQPDVRAVGVPLVPADGSGAFAFNCGAPAFQLTRERLEKDIGPRLVNMARNVEAALNSR